LLIDLVVLGTYVCWAWVPAEILVFLWSNRFFGWWFWWLGGRCVVAGYFFACGMCVLEVVVMLCVMEAFWRLLFSLYLLGQSSSFTCAGGGC